MAGFWSTFWSEVVRSFAFGVGSVFSASFSSPYKPLRCETGGLPPKRTAVGTGERGGFLCLAAL